MPMFGLLRCGNKHIRQVSTVFVPFTITDAGNTVRVICTFSPVRLGLSSTPTIHARHEYIARIGVNIETLNGS